MTPEQIAEWRARAILGSCALKAKDSEHEWYKALSAVAPAIAQADAKNHLGYFDTRTHVAIPREPSANILYEAGVPESLYKRIIAASENEDGGTKDG